MKNVYLFILVCLTFQVKAQFTTCNDAYVISYKEGTSCTASNYNFFTLNPLDGTVSSTPFLSITNNTKEINGFGVNNFDLKIYGILYDRSGSCTFSNFKLFKIENGVLVDLGSIVPPTDGINIGNIEGAFGCISLSGDFIFRANINIASTVYTKIGKIEQIQNLTPQTQITAAYTTISTSFTGRNFADWATHPVTGDLYTYTMQTGTSGTPTNGQLAKLDLTTMSLDLTGAVTNDVFLDAARDNFGGIMFTENGKIIGVNVNTRKLYEINTATGEVTFLSTVPSTGGGQIRTDLGSCRNGNFLLSLDITSFSGFRKNSIDEINLVTANEKNITAIDIESSEDGLHFNKTGSFVPKNNLQKNYYKTTINPLGKISYYRIKIQSEGKTHFSNIIQLKNNTTGLEFKAIESSVTKQIFSITAKESGLYKIQYFNTVGQSIYQKTINIQKGVQQIELSNNLSAKGLVVATISKNDFATTAKFVIKN